MTAQLTAATAGARTHVTRVLDAIDWPHVSGRYRALHFDFAFRVPDAGLGRYLGDVLAPLRDDGEPAHVYSLVDRGPGRRRRYHLYLDGTKVESARRERTAAAILTWHVNRMAVQRSPRYLTIHAAAVTLEGRAVILAGPQEAGKTTLATALVQAGFGYLTDEATAIDPATQLVHAYPKSLSIDPGAQPLFADLARPVEDAASRWASTQWAVDPRAIRPDAVASPSPVAAVLFVRYDPSGPTRLEALPRAEAVLELAQQAFNFRLHGSSGFHTLVALAGSATCHRLTVSDLDGAVRTVTHLLTNC